MIFLLFVCSGMAVFPLFICWVDSIESGTEVPAYAKRMLVVAGAFVGAAYYLLFAVKETKCNFQENHSICKAWYR